MNKVFISYRHDGGDYSKQVSKLAEELRVAGIEVVLDTDKLPGGPDEGWPMWSQQQVEKCDKVLIASTQGWKESYEAETPLNSGRGAAAEARIIRQQLYETSFVNSKFRVVLLNEADEESIPTGLRAYHHYRLYLPEGQSELLAWLGVNASSTKPTIPWPAISSSFKRRLANCEAEFDTLLRMLQGNSPQRALLIRGPSGRGKTLLINEFRRLARHVSLNETFIDFKNGMGLEHAFRCLATDLDNVFSPATGEALSDQRKRLMAALKEMRCPHLLLLDTFEQAPEEVCQWIESDLLGRLHHYPALIVAVCGQSVPSEQHAIWRDDAQAFALGPISNPKKWQEFCGHNSSASEISEDFIQKLVFATDGDPAQIGPILNQFASRLVASESIL